MHELTPIAITLAVTTVIGIIMVRVRQPAMIGYMLCGLLLGPFGLGVIDNQDSVALLAELGVILLLYFIGMELSLSVFRHIWRIALISAVAQLMLSILAVLAVATLLNIPTNSAIVLGFCLAFSSTAVAIRMLENNHMISRESGKIAMGILVAQDLLVAPALIAINLLVPDTEVSMWQIIRYSAGLLLLVGTCVYFLQRNKIDLPFAETWTGDDDLAPLVSVMLCLTAAAAAATLGMSAGFGAFFAGLVVANSRQRHAVHDNAKPLQSVLLMVFFLAVGLLLDLAFIVEHLWAILAFWLLVLVFKTALNILIIHIQGASLKNSIIASLSLSQLGEFSFMLTAVAFSIGVFDDFLRQMVISVTALSLITSPIYFDAIRRLSRPLRQNRDNWRSIAVLYASEFRLMRVLRHAFVRFLISRGLFSQGLSNNKKHPSTDKEAEQQKLIKHHAPPSD